MNNENYKVKGHVVITDEKSNVLLDKDNMILKAGRKEIMQNGVTAFTAGKVVLGYDSQNTIVASGDEYRTYFSDPTDDANITSKKVGEITISNTLQILKLKGSELANYSKIINGAEYNLGYKTGDTAICFYKKDTAGYAPITKCANFGYPANPGESNENFRYIADNTTSTGFSSATDESDITMYFTVSNSSENEITIYTYNKSNNASYIIDDSENLTLEYYIPYSVSGSSNVQLNTLGIATSETTPRLLTRVSFTSVELTHGSIYNIKYTLYF